LPEYALNTILDEIDSVFPIFIDRKMR